MIRLLKKYVLIVIMVNEGCEGCFTIWRMNSTATIVQTRKAVSVSPTLLSHIFQDDIYLKLYVFHYYALKLKPYHIDIGKI